MFDAARRITIVSRDPGARRVVIHERTERKRKRSKWLKPLEQVERRLLRADADFAREMLRRHNRSTARRKDGWLYDGLANLLRAEAKYYDRLMRN